MAHSKALISSPAARSRRRRRPLTLLLALALFSVGGLMPSLGCSGGKPSANSPAVDDDASPAAQPNDPGGQPSVEPSADGESTGPAEEDVEVPPAP